MKPKTKNRKTTVSINIISNHQYLSCNDKRHSQEAPVNEETTDGATAALSPSVEGNKCWQVFMNYLDTSDERGDKDERLVCKLDRDLADSLDDCDIHNRSRSDMVNAIVRAFFETYLPQLSEFRRKKKSLFINFNKEDYEME